MSRRRLILLALAGVFVAFAAYGSLVPLRWNAIPLEAAVARFAQTPFIPLSRASRSDLLTNVLLFVPIGFFLQGAAANRSRGLAAVWLVPVVLVGFALSIAIEFGQIFVSGRTPSWNDVFAETLGSALGAMTWAAFGTAGVDWLAGARARSPPLSSGGTRLWPLGALAVWCVVLMVRHWRPFDFVADSSFVRSRLPIMFQVPFHSYYGAMPLWALIEASSKFLLGIPVGALLQWMWLPSSLRLRSIQVLGISLVSMALFFGIELGQLLLPTRVPDQTDVYIATAGAIGGLVVVRLVVGAAR